MKFIDYLNENIFKPSGIKSLSLDDSRINASDRTEGYRKSKSGEVVDAVVADTSIRIPGGGLAGTVEDLARFAIAVQNNRLLKKATLEQMWQQQNLTDGKGTSYGLGWGVSELNGKKEISHGGMQQGVTTYLYIRPDDGFAVAIMMNVEGVERRLEISQRLVGIIIQK